MTNFWLKGSFAQHGIEASAEGAEVVNYESDISGWKVISFGVAYIPKC
jgi:hypothetical protein